MNFKSIFHVLLIAVIAISLVDAKKKKGKGKKKSGASAAAAVAVTNPNQSDNDVASLSTSVPGPTENQLSEVYDKMSGVTNGLSMNLDSSFGGGRCNCVCEDNN